MVEIPNLMFLFTTLCAFVLIYWLFVFKDTKGICFFTPNNQTDNERMLTTSFEYNEIGFLNWPGNIHYLNNGRGRAELREYWIIFLSFLQKLFPTNEKFSERVLVTLSLSSHCLSTILIYLLSNYFLPNYISFCISLIYLASSWCAEVAIYFGHIIFAQFWFLCSIGFLLIAYANNGNSIIFLMFLFFSGFLSSICFSSSSSSRKFIPGIIFSQLYTCYFLFTDASNITTIYCAILIILSFIFTRPILKRIFNFISISIISKLQVSNPLRNKENEDYALNFLSPILSIVIAIIVPAILARDSSNYLKSQFVFGLGMLISFLIVLMPSPLANIKRYISFLEMGKWASHFAAYPNQQKTFGRELPSNFRGGGLRWIFPFFWNVMPVELIIFGLTLISMGFCFVIGEISFTRLCLIIFIGILPTLIVEITNGIQVGKSYLSSLSGILITIVLGYESIEMTFSILTPFIFAFLTLLQVLRLIKNYRNDILPCRMGPTKLRQFLLKNNIKDFYTYDTSYNNQFVNNVIYGFESTFKVNFVKSINECPKDSYFVVPPTSSKSVSMETELEAIVQGDFRKDNVLNSLLDSNSINKYSIGKFKTLGCSKFYVNESEVTGYRYHVLKQISERDRILSYGWVLDLKLLPNIHEM